MVLIRPYKATHAVLQTAEGKKAMVSIDDLDTLEGTEGRIRWMRLTKNSREVLGEIVFDGKIEEIKSDYKTTRSRSR
jgi:hypothetical protein|tara:strand:+ start:274 stop:504 length:231 start_codon:yes stop_codon:yes gene_type:complete